MKNIFLLTILLFIVESNFAENLRCIGEAVKRTSFKNEESPIIKRKYDEIIEFGTINKNGKIENFLINLTNNETHTINKKGTKEFSNTHVYIYEKNIIGKYYFQGDYDNPKLNARFNQIEITIDRYTGELRIDNLERYSGENNSSSSEVIEAKCVKVEKKF